jgi:GNAT superfamily N-acetyltransferase
MTKETNAGRNSTIRTDHKPDRTEGPRDCCGATDLELDLSARLAVIDDAAEIGRLLHQFNTEFDTPSPGAEVLSERLTKLLAGKSMFAIVAGSPPLAVGLVSLRPNVWYQGRVALLDELYVSPAHRNKGIGSAILRLLHEHADIAGLDAIEINVDEGDIDAQRFYERHGYSSTEPNSGERAFYYTRESYPAT